VAEPTKFVVAGTQRTGTTLLRTSLSSHPRIVCHGEVFKLGKKPYALPGGYWAFTRVDSAHRLQAAFFPRHACRNFLAELYGHRECSAIGFKLMLDQCEARPYLWPLVLQHQVKTILVTRRNLLKTLVSRQTAASTGVYHVSATLPAKSAVANWAARPVRIEAATVIRDLDAIAVHDRIGLLLRAEDRDVARFESALVCGDAHGCVSQRRRRWIVGQSTGRYLRERLHGPGDTDRPCFGDGVRFVRYVHPGCHLPCP